MENGTIKQEGKYSASVCWCLMHSLHIEAQESVCICFVLYVICLPFQSNVLLHILFLSLFSLIFLFFIFLNRQSICKVTLLIKFLKPFSLLQYEMLVLLQHRSIFKWWL
jgi:hypothetical protein